MQRADARSREVAGGEGGIGFSRAGEQRQSKIKCFLVELKVMLGFGHSTGVSLC